MQRKQPPRDRYRRKYIYVSVMVQWIAARFMGSVDSTESVIMVLTKDDSQTLKISVSYSRVC
jgi:hypothetical protein